MAAVPQQIRHEWYQTDQKVVVELFIKNAQNRNCEVNIKSDHVVVNADDLPEVKFNLLHPINFAQSTHKFSTLKIELTLVKLSGERWSTLEKTTESAPTPAPIVHSAPVAVEQSSAQSGSSGVVPKHPKDWDKLVKDIWEKEDLEKVSITIFQIQLSSPNKILIFFNTQYELQNETDALNSLFQKIYSDSDPEIQRAMNKSYTESGNFRKNCYIQFVLNIYLKY